MGLFDSLFGKTVDLKEMIKNGATIVDVRSPGEFQGGHVAGSINIPLNTVENEVERFKTLAAPVILCCASGNRSGQATRFLENQGVECVNGGGWTNVNAQV